jgi:hypothetical protein
MEAELGHICGTAAWDLLKSLLSLDPIQRPSAGSALMASYFKTKPFARHHTQLGQVPTGTSCHVLRTAGLRPLTREGPVTRSVDPNLDCLVHHASKKQMGRQGQLA